MIRPAALLAPVLAVALVSSSALSARDLYSAQACALQAAGVYGFQCQGQASAGGPLEPVTFIGTVEGRDDGFYEGFGTFSSSQGSNATHVAGWATFGKYCRGRIAYTTNEIQLPGGGTIPLSPLIIDFVPVNDFSEILGTPVAPGSTGDMVPRLACRLVRIK